MSFDIYIDMGYGARLTIPAATIEHEKIIGTDEGLVRKVDLSFEKPPTIEYIEYWEWFWNKIN